MALPLVEYFTQARATERLGRETLEVRGERRVVVARARQKRDAAEALWAVSQPSEALALAKDALALFAGAVESAGTGDDVLAKLASLGVGKRAAERAAKVLEGAPTRELPTLDADVRTKDGETFRELGDVCATLDEALADTVLVRREIVVRRVLRTTLTAVGTVVVLAGAFFLLRTPPPPPATASGIYADDPAFGAERVIDGDASTEWLLPDQTAGWVDVRVDPARNVTRVHLVNGHNREFNDRAVRGYRVEVYDGGRMVAQTTGEFASLLPRPTPVDVAVRATHVTRVRLVVTSWFGMGGALAELAAQ